MRPAATGDLPSVCRRLGDLVDGHPERVDSVVPQLVAILSTTEDAQVVQTAVEALGRSWHPSAAAALLEHVRLDRADPGVRLALAQTLAGGVDAPGDLRDRVTNALTGLTQDADPRVRDWAAFGLGQLQARSPRARDAWPPSCTTPTTTPAAKPSSP